jgi:hypothetical protein
MAPIPKSKNSSGNSLGQETAAIWRLTKLFPRSSDFDNFLPKANVLQLFTLPFCDSSQGRRQFRNLVASATIEKSCGSSQPVPHELNSSIAILRPQ